MDPLLARSAGQTATQAQTLATAILRMTASIRERGLVSLGNIHDKGSFQMASHCKYPKEKNLRQTRRLLKLIFFGPVPLVVCRSIFCAGKGGLQFRKSNIFKMRPPK